MLFKIFCILILLIAQCEAAGISSVQPEPIREVSPYVGKDKSAVIAFFKFGCPACRSFHAALSNWGKSLPKGISFQFFPVAELTDKGSVSDEALLGGQAFWVAEMAGSTVQREGFAAEAYSLVQDEKAGTNRDRWFDILLSQGIKRQLIVSAWQAELAQGEAHLLRQAHYRPTVTPSLVICGKWMISPDSTNGDIGLFAQLANGLVSQCADERGLKVLRK